MFPVPRFTHHIFCKFNKVFSSLKHGSHVGSGVCGFDNVHLQFEWNKDSLICADSETLLPARYKNLISTWGQSPIDSETIYSAPKVNISPPQIYAFLLLHPDALVLQQKPIMNQTFQWSPFFRDTNIDTSTSSIPFRT